MSQGATPPPGVNSALESLLAKGNGGGKDGIPSLATLGVKSANPFTGTGAALSPTNLGTFVSAPIPKPAFKLPTSPLGFTVNPAKMFNGFPGGGGDGPSVA